MAAENTVPAGGAPVRASDADRERVAAAVRDAAAAGRLTLDEADERLAAVYAARYLHELPPLTADLGQPAADPPPTRPARPRRARPSFRPAPSYLTGYLALSALLIGIWAVTGAGYFWPVWPILGVGVKMFGWGGWHRGWAASWGGRSRRYACRSADRAPTG